MSRYRIILLFTSLLAVASAGIAADKWKPLKKDGIHDPANPAIKVLQEPADALSVLQVDTAGNMVDWARSLEYGFIKPRGSIDGKYEAEVLESTVLMTNTRPLRYVRFPHKTHTQWMSCETCHDRIFIAEVDANPINMGKILNGEYCGLCHGAVAFPLTECDRCHNTDSSTVGRAATAPARDEGS
ncbi:MAG TPA: c(7)-type cytochrome triheme domain-containing protein [Woeseiaceae bacterium]